MGNTKKTLTLAFTTAVGGRSDPKMIDRVKKDPTVNLDIYNSGYDTEPFSRLTGVKLLIPLFLSASRKLRMRLCRIRGIVRV